MNNTKTGVWQDIDSIIGAEAAKLNQEYIDMYEAIADTDSRIIKIVEDKKNNYFTFHDSTNNMVMTIVKKDFKGKFIVLPIGIAAKIAKKIMSEFKDVDASGLVEVDPGDNCFDTLLYAMSLPDNEQIDVFLFYLNVIVLDHFQLDSYESIVHIDKTDYVLVEGIKNEFVTVPGVAFGIEYENVTYIIESWNNRKYLRVHKQYTTDMEDDEYTLSIDDIIRNQYNDFK